MSIINRETTSRAMAESDTGKLIPQEHINMVLRFHLYCARITGSLRRSYSKLLASFDCSISGSIPPDRDWDWRKLSVGFPGSAALNTLSTTWMAYALLRELMFEHISSFLDTLSLPYLDRPGSCLLLGRMVSHPQMESWATIICCGFHLIWRLLEYFADHNFKLTALQFLFHSEHDLKRFYKLIAAQEAGLDSQLPPPPPPPPLSPSWNGVSQRQMRPALDFGPIFWGSPEEALESPAWTSCGQFDVNELLMRHTMSYLVYQGGRAQCRLRPNRTLEARRKLACQLLKSFKFASLLMLGCTLLIGPYLFLVVFSDSRYRTAYPGCTPELDELHRHNQLPRYGLSSLPTGHRLLALIADILENLIIWLDSGFAITFVTTFGYVFNYDILLYWSGIKVKLDSILQRARERQLLEGHLSLSRHRQQQRQQQQQQQNEKAQMYNSFRRSSNEGSMLKQHAIARLNQELKLEIRELQFEIFDFFNEVKRVDLFLSDVLTLAIIIWLTSWLLIGFNIINGSLSTFPILMIAIELVGLFVMITASHMLFELRRSCLQSYNSLCSLMALDESKLKCHFIKVLEFFTQLSRTSYRIAHSYPYEPTTFITIMGWSASCFILTLTLFNPHGAFSRAHQANSTASQSS